MGIRWLYTVDHRGKAVHAASWGDKAIFMTCTATMQTQSILNYSFHQALVPLQQKMQTEVMINEGNRSIMLVWWDASHTVVRIWWIWCSYYKIAFFFPIVSPGEDGSESRPETPASDISIESRSYQTCANTALKVLGGLLMVLCVSSSWVGTTQVVKLTFQSFSCPFFISWFSSNWNILFFPIYYSGHVFTTGEKQTPIQKFR